MINYTSSGMGKVKRESAQHVQNNVIINYKQLLNLITI